MVDAFHEAWSLLKSKQEKRFPSWGLEGTYGPKTESEAVDAHFRKKGPQNWMTSFVNQDGKQTKKRGFFTPPFDKSRFIVDEYNLTGPSRTPLGMGGSTSDVDEEFLNAYEERGPMEHDPQPLGTRAQMGEPQKDGLSQEEYDNWQKRLNAMLESSKSQGQMDNQSKTPNIYSRNSIWNRSGSAAPN